MNRRKTMSKVNSPSLASVLQPNAGLIPQKNQVPANLPPQPAAIENPEVATAIEAKGWMDMAAGLYQRSLQSALDKGTSIGNNLQSSADRGMTAGKEYYNSWVG